MLENIRFGEHAGAGLGFNPNEASTSGTKQVTFIKLISSVKTVDDTVIGANGTTKISGTVVPSRAEVRTESILKNNLSPKPSHVVINNTKVPISSKNVVKTFYKPCQPPGLDL